MHEIARRACEERDTIESLTEMFYGPDGPLVEAGWEIRAQQREMSVQFARQIDRGAPWLSRAGPESEASISLIEAPCGTGKSNAYLVPGILAAMRAEATWWRRKRAEARAERAEARAEAEQGQTAEKPITATPKDHPAKLVVSTANIALQSQIIRKDIPAVMEMLGYPVRATLMKSRQNYVCRAELLQVAGKLTNRANPDLQRLSDEVLGNERHTGDREASTWDVGQVWPMVSVTAEDCLRDGCAHWDPNADVGGCWWRKVTAAWPMSHVIVANHHWAALTKGISAIGYAIDEAHKLEDAVRGVQGKTATTASYVSIAARLAAPLKEERATLEDLLVPVATRLFDTVERYMVRVLGDVEPTSMDFKRPVPLPADWTPTGFRKVAVSDLAALLQLRDVVVKAAKRCSPVPIWRDGRLMATAKTQDEEGKRARSLVSCANRLIDLCQLYASAVKGRPHPAWPSSDSTWAIWAQRERLVVDGAERWRVVLNLTPADVAPFFAYLHARYPTMLLTSATLPEFTSMRLSLGLGAKWEREPALPWPAVLRTDVGELAGIEGGAQRPDEDGYEEQTGVDGGEDGRDEDAGLSGDDEPISRGVPPVSMLAPAPCCEQRLPSPYPLEEQGLLVIPQGPLPKETTRWQAWAVERVVAAVYASSGGALVLATSNVMLNRYAMALRAERRWNVLRQGDGGRQQVIEQFKADTDSVLVGTRSFFEGLDVQGESCRLVVIDKVPFASPDDPLELAVGDLLVQRARATETGGRDPNAYLLRTVPEASMVLVQGAGRLIRSRADRGVVMLLDGRVLQPGKGWTMILDALPPFPLSRDPADVMRHLAGVKTSARPLHGPSYTPASLPDATV